MHNRVGLGTFPLSGVFNKVSTKEAENIIRKFLDEGGYYIDTAPMYGNGEIEKMLGRVLKNIPREKYYLISKTVYHINEKGLYKSGKYGDVINNIDKSLSRLGLDYVNQLMVHSPDKDTPISETLKAIEEIQKSGKAKDLAVSNVSLDELREYNKNGNIKFVENRYSLISRSLSGQFEKYLINNKIGLIPYHLLEIGMLTDAVTSNFKLRDGDLRDKLPYWNKENQKVIFGWVGKSLAPIAKRAGITLAQLSISWALSQPFINFVIAGTTRPDYLESNLKANGIKLDNESLLEINSAYKKLENQVKTKYGQTMREFRGLNEKYY